MPPSKAAVSKSTGKRKLCVQSDSEIEVLDAPPVHRKKKQATLKTAPASVPNEQPIYDMLPSPDFSKELAALLSQNAPPSDKTGTSPRPTRNRTKTEKARLMDAAPPTPKRGSRKVPASPVKEELSSDDDLPRRVMPILPAQVDFSAPAGTAGITDTAPTTPKHISRKILPPPVEDGSDSDDVPPDSIHAVQVCHSATPASDDPESVAVPFDDINALASSLFDNMAPELGSADVAEDASVTSSVDAASLCSDGSSHESIADATDLTPDVGQKEVVFELTLPVMVKELQHPKLYQIYEGLPILSRFREVILFGGRPNDTVERVDFAVIMKRLGKDTILIIIRGLTFFRSGFFVNTARIDPRQLGMDTRRLVMANTTTPAVCMMMGTVICCDLIGEHTSGSYTCHRIGILPFAQEMRRDSSVWGMVLGLEKIIGPVESGGFAFHTRPKANVQGMVQSPQTPKRNKSSMSMTITSPSSRSHASTSGGGRGFYPVSRSFEDKIPIYDGRTKSTSPFTFTNRDFDKLTSMPLYKKGRKDLPVDAVVSVGYTLNTYNRHYNGASTEHLSANVQFVILLGINA